MQLQAMQAKYEQIEQKMYPTTVPQSVAGLKNHCAFQDKDYITRTTKNLRLEFKRILKVDNLDNLTSLTRLFLDNNFIEQISGLDSLVHLVWLDLSFNRIRRIEGP